MSENRDFIEGSLATAFMQMPTEDVEGLMGPTVQAMEALRAEYPDVVDAEGNILPDPKFDGLERMSVLASDRETVRRLPTPMLKRMREALDEQDAMLKHRRDRLFEYRRRLHDIVVEFSTKVEASDDPAWADLKESTRAALAEWDEDLDGYQEA